MANEVEYGEASPLVTIGSPSIRNDWAGRAVTAATMTGKRLEKSLPWRVMSFSSGHDAEAVMLNFVQPARPGWRALGRGRQTRFDNA